MNQEKIIVIDFGGQYNQLVARRVRECHVYCEIYSYRTPIEQIKAMNPKGIILTGGPNSVYEEGAATCSKELFEMGVPVLGLCYGAQLMSHVLGGHVCKAPVREYGKIEVTVDKTSKLFGDVSEKTICWMSHNDYIEKEAPGFRIVAHTPDCPVAAAECEEKKLYAIQFHPEVLHTLPQIPAAPYQSDFDNICFFSQVPAFWKPAFPHYSGFVLHHLHRHPDGFPYTLGGRSYSFPY